MLWIESVLERKLPSHDMHENLKSGIVLRELVLLISALQALNLIISHYSLLNFIQDLQSVFRLSVENIVPVWHHGKKEKTFQFSSNNAKRRSYHHFK